LISRRASDPDCAPLPTLFPASISTVELSLSSAPRSAKNIVFLSTDRDWRKALGSGFKLPAVVTVGLKVPWRELRCPLCSIILKTAKDGFSDFLRKHQARKINWFCIKCHSLKQNSHSATCHAAKCGLNKHACPTANKTFKCETCPASFRTSRGLSMHTKKHGSAGRKRRAGEPDDGFLSNLEGLFTPLPSPINKRVKQPKRTLKSCMLTIIRNEDVPPGGLHPLKSSPAHVNKTLSYVRQMKRSNKISTRNPWKPSRFRAVKRNIRAGYQTIQSLYKNNAAAAASLILDGKEARSCNIPNELWEKQDKYTELGVFDTLPEADNEPLLMPVTPGEVMAALQGSRGKSAPGLDGIRKSHLSRWDKDGQLLACLFNTILYNSKLPKLLKRSRTTLVPKSSDQEKLKSIDCWRPITLSSTILRLFSRILCDRLGEACPIHPSQKGFIRGEGCSWKTLDVKIKKCGGFFLKATKQSMTLNECADWKINADPIPMISEAQPYKYLGVEVSPRKGILPSDPLKEITQILCKIGRAPLKPTQKVKMLVTYDIPRVVYAADMSLVSMVDLKRADLEIRNRVKSWLHLSPSTADGLFYSARVDGGLGLPKLEKQIPICQVKRWCKMMQAKDIKCRTLAPSLLPKLEIARRWKVATEEEGEGELLEKLALTDPATVGKKWRESEYKRWCGLKCQGRGLTTFAKDPISNNWLGDHKGLHESDYILALQLRSNTVGTLTTLSRGRHRNTTCRAGGKGWEGTAHIVSQCKSFKKNRMANHNIYRLLASIGLSLGWEVMQEKRITCPLLGTAVPDLIMIKDGRGLVVDVAICFEMKPATLRHRAETKVNKYEKLAPQICNTFGLTDVQTYGFPLGARGKWYGGNSEVLKQMGLPRSKRRTVAKLFSVVAIRGTTKLLKAFK
uniref:C2H2-type domain-containing protein n=1 Tax=Poecilia formosa TaxID=48698 RepID=A0A087XDC3_POEFO